MAIITIAIILAMTRAFHHHNNKHVILVMPMMVVMAMVLITSMEMVGAVAILMERIVMTRTMPVGDT